jgi:hypothetical protein
MHLEKMTAMMDAMEKATALLISSSERLTNALAFGHSSFARPETASGGGKPRSSMRKPTAKFAEHAAPNKNSTTAKLADDLDSGFTESE